MTAAPGAAGLKYISFDAFQLKEGEQHDGTSGMNETALIVLGGRCTVCSGTERFEGIGERPNVWSKTPPYVVLLPPNTKYRVQAESALHLVVASAPAAGIDGEGRSTATTAGQACQSGVSRLITPDQIAVEHRGEGQTYRYIHHLLPPTADASRLILVEVYTPAGNWSSFPPHKHDTEDPPQESFLEEVYYYQVRPQTGFALQRVYTPDRSVDETLAPGDGDLVLVPRGYHPVAATPGHECYYLNVMAGPTRAWNFQVDPDYAHLMNWQKPAVAGDERR
ncbi:MAG TPA: 5-deoxy-glucuronate isomerase [Chloroflexota bacterium]|nr:5-deoxy-glucuronate isomerase [Chloroflexota bacterium]